MNVATHLGVECKVYSPPFHPQSNGRIEGFHNFLKVCMSKHVFKSLEWDQVIPFTWTAYKVLPNEHSKESSLFLMFARDPIILLNSLLTPTVRYLGTNENILTLEALKICTRLLKANWNKLKRKWIPNPLYLTENVVRMILFYLRITLPVCGTLGIPETVESYPIPERLKLRWWIQKVK